MPELPNESSNSLQPFACDGRIGEEKLYELLAVGGEYPSLDFKRELNLNDPAKKLDFIKDCAAMMNLPRGGYLVIGANDDGTLAVSNNAPTKEMFDSAQLTQIVKGYVDGAIDIRAQVHTVQVAMARAVLALIYIAPPSDGIPAIMSKNGVVSGDRGNKPLFHQGMIFTREGSTNAPVRHQTWAQVLDNLRERQKADARADVDSLVHRVVQMMGTTATPHPVTPDMDMDSATFVEAVRATLDAGRNSVVNRFLIQARGAYRDVDVDDEARGHILNRIAAVACEAILADSPKTVAHAVDAMFDLYKSYLGSTTNTDIGKPGAARHWLEIILRILAVGAMAIRVGTLEVIPTLVLRQIGDEIYSYRSWIRHALTMASRANLLPSSGGSTRGGGIISLANEIMTNVPELRPDSTAVEDQEDTIELLLDSLCQFDLLWCCLSLASAAEDMSSEAYYPSCAAYMQNRSMPILALIDSDASARQKVFGEIDDEKIATSILRVLESAKNQSWELGSYWSGSRSLTPHGFIHSHANIGGISS